MSRFQKLGTLSISALALSSEIMPFINDKRDFNGIFHTFYQLLNKTSTCYLKNINKEIVYTKEIRKNLKLSIEMKIID